MITAERNDDGTGIIRAVGWCLLFDLVVILVAVGVL